MCLGKWCFVSATVGPEREARGTDRPGPSWLALACALLIGSLVRVSYVLPRDFPLTDGGLFYLMIQELQDARYALPACTSYNGAGIPFAYPPLGLYLAGLLDEIGPWSLLDVLRYLPLVANLLSIPAFHALSRDLLPPRAAIFATFAFALLPGSFTWQIMGGGVTRSPGFTFAILAIWQVHRLYTRGGRRHLVAAVALSGAAALSHLAMGWLVAVSAGLLFLAYGRSRAGVGRSLLVGASTLAVTAPWWVTVLARHGLGPFLAAGRSPEPALAGLASLLMLSLTDEALFPLLGALALVGVVACLGQRRLLLPGWLAAAFLLDPRTARTTATLPLALLAGVAVAEVLAGLEACSTNQASSKKPGLSSLSGHLLAFLLVYASVSAVLAVLPLVQGLSAEERQAMAWVAGHTPEGSTFLVITGDRMWGGDRTSEWFPVLARRVSLATVQGTEWLPGFAARARRYIALQRCATQDAACLERWVQQAGVTFSHVYVAKRPPVARGASADCCTGLLSALACDSRYRLVYDGPGASVYRRQQAVAPGGPGR